MPEFPLNDAFLTTEILKLAVESAGTGVWRVDPRTRSVELTAALKQMLGVPVDRPMDYATFLALVHPDDVERTRQELTGALFSAKDTDLAFRIVRADGETRWLVARGRAYFDGAGDDKQPTLFIGTARDVTDAKTAEAALQTALEQQEKLLHEVNHRVKNSLQLVSSLLRLQARRLPDAVARRQLEDATARISTIAYIHQRLYRDRDVSQLDFGVLLSELCSDLQSSATHCQLDVRAPSLPMKADRAIPLALIVNELVTNAFKYAYPGGGGRIAVRVGVSGKGISITVEDHGAGLPEGFKTTGGGNLGMLLIGSLLGQLSARLEVRETDGGGATFIVTTPAA